MSKPLSVDEIRNRIVRVERIRLGDISPNPRNPKKHPQAQRDAIRGSVRELGFGTVPIAYTSQRLGGKLAFGDGHMRGDEFAELVTDVAITDYTDEEIDKFLLYADPIAAMAEYEAAQLDSLLRDVQTSDEALQAMLAGMAESAGLYQDKKPVADPGTQVTETEAERLAKEYNVQTGQTWQLGQHLIACVDSLDEQEVEAVIGENKVGFIWADPPYGISIVATNVSVGGGEAYDIPFGGVKKRRGNVGLGSSNGAKPFGNEKLRGSVGAANMIDVGKYAPVIGDETTQTAEKSTDLYLRLYPDALHVWWGANYYANVLPPSSCWIVWDKENTGNFADAELAWCSDKSAVRIFKHMWNGLMKDSEKGKRRVHPTQKPVALAHWCFEKYGKAGDVIVDPFLGSGISVLAAEQLNDNRRVIGFELAPEYIAVTIHRWEMLTGRKAELATGQQPVRV